MNIELPFPEAKGTISLESAIRTRSTERKIGNNPVSLAHLSMLLWAGQGKRKVAGKLNAPSAGGQNPLTLFVVASAHAELGSKAYEYDNGKHQLQLISGTHVSKSFSHYGIGSQPWMDLSTLNIVIAGNIEATKQHFSEQVPLGIRGERYVYIESGAVAQNIHLQATGLGVKMVLVGGFDDKKLKTDLRLAKHLEPTAILCLG